MKNILIIFFLALIISCANEKPVTGALTDYIPRNPALIVQMKNPDLFFSNLQNNDFLRQNSGHPLHTSVKRDLELLNYFPHEQESLLVLNPKEKNSFDFLLITRGEITLKNPDSIPNRQVETTNHDGLAVKKYILEGKTAFSTLIDSIGLMSNSLDLLKEASRGSAGLDPDLQTAFKAASVKKTSLLLNSEKANSFLREIFPHHFPGFSKWTVVDADISQNNIGLNGITVSTDTIPRLVNVFKETGVAKNTLASLAPVSSKGFTSISFKDFEKLNENMAFLRGNNAEPIASEEFSLLTTAREAGVIELAQEMVFAINTEETANTRSAFPFELKQVEEYREIAIFEYPDSNRFQEILQPLLNPEELHFFAFLDTYILFAKTSEALKEVIAAVQNELVLANTEAYKAALANLTSEASLLIVENNQAGRDDALKGLDYTGYPITAAQYIYQDNFAHVHVILPKNSALKTEKATSQVATVKIAAPLASPPAFFKNHRTNGKDIVVQDVQNTLYLISPEGKIYWKKSMDFRILGDIKTIDILRNGRYQLAFATQNALHVIDRDGNPVKPFPLKFRDNITQPLAVFDYDNKKDYRLLIVQGKDLLMYDRKGKRVKGFDFDQTSSTITQTPKHIRIGRKDYIVVPETSGNLNILNRTGDIRVAVKENLDLTQNEWFEYNGSFISSNNSGQLIRISETGNIAREDLNLASNHRLAATEETLVTLSENELKIKENTVTLDFGLYSEPQIFYLNNKIYVSVTDLQTKKVYLFDSNAALLTGFPVYGTSTVDLANIDSDAVPELTVQGDENEVLVYELNP